MMSSRSVGVVAFSINCVIDALARSKRVAAAAPSEVPAAQLMQVKTRRAVWSVA